MTTEKARPQKNTLLKSAQANAETNFFKRVFFSPTQEEFFSPLFFLFFFHHHRSGSMLYLTDSASNVNIFVDSLCKLDKTPLRTERRASGNSTYKKLAIQWLNETLCFVSSSVVADSLVLRNRQLLVAAKR